MAFDRRTLLKATGAAGAATLASPTATAAARSIVVDDELDTDGGLQETIVVFESRDRVDVLDRFDLERGYYKFDALPVGYAFLTGDQIRAVADLPTVRSVEANRELDWHNEDSREVTGAGRVHEDLFYTGETVHAAVIDSGIDGDHPDHRTNLRANFQFANPLASGDGDGETDEQQVWTDVGPADTDTVGHGTHCAGSVAGDGTDSDGRYEGMAPDADLTVYAAGATLLVLQPLAAYDHVIAHKRRGETDVDLISNSYGGSAGNDYSPTAAANLATWEAYREGILSLYSAGNSGPDTNTVGDNAMGPHVMSIAATHDDMSVTDFSSRARTPEYDDGEDTYATNYDRGAAFENLRQFHAADKKGPELGGDSVTATIGPNAEVPLTGVEQGTGSQYYEVTLAEEDLPDSAGFVEASLSWTDPAQDMDLYLHRGTEDDKEQSTVAASTGGTGTNPEVLSATVDGRETYFLEVHPYTVVQTQFTLTWTVYEEGDPTEKPVGLYRNSVGAPGSLVMSTLSPGDALQPYAAANAGQPEEQDAEPYYGKISGTSMSCPVTAGVAALVIDAWKQNHDGPAAASDALTDGAAFDPVEIINVIENTALDALDSYSPWNVGAGFVDAHGAVQAAEAGTETTFLRVSELPDPEEDATDEVFRVDGSRSDGGSVYTAGQTVRVEIEIAAATDEAVVRDRIPFDWEIVGGSGAEVTANATRFVEFTGVSEGDTLDYFLEAPESTGRYQFGPARARPADGSRDFARFTESETNSVVGVDQNSLEP